MIKCDVLVIGGGPAGLMAAKHAAMQGANVLLLEAKGSFGLKPCGEGVSSACLEAAEVKPSSDVVVEKIRGFEVYAPDETRRVRLVSEGEVQGYIIDKRRFLQRLAEAAQDRGAEVKVEANVVDVRLAQDGVSVDVRTPTGKVEVNAKLAIGCEGYTSIVARKYFDREGYELIPCVQYRMRNVELPHNDVLMFYVGSKVAPGGYAWIFPRGDKIANVGLGVRRGGPATSYLEAFVKRRGDVLGKAEVIELGAAAVPVGGMLKHIVADGLMLCGDSAGQVIPLTGGGIHSSLAAGRIGGEVAGRKALENDVSAKALGEYPARYEEPWGSRIRRSLKALKVIDSLSDDDLNLLAGAVNGEDVVNIANGWDLVKVAAKLMKHPTLALKVARKLF
ncbi:MAG: NAD(P)/FAD-dependent oxidoreductase [Candidatus Nezhaarchaeota archaeon]|nr:NAD(P)/FAD-dependent oxidoreductase [Candidatus Nezhaarchaeota archaeon]